MAAAAGGESGRRSSLLASSLALAALFSASSSLLAAFAAPPGPAARGGLIARHAADPSSAASAGADAAASAVASGGFSLPSFDLGAWFSGALANPTVNGMWERYTSEVARSLADWTGPIIALLLVAVIYIIRGIFKGGDDDADEDDEEGAMMSPFGGSASKKPQLKIRNWNQQVDRYAIATTKAVEGREAARKLQRKLKEGYAKREKEAAEAAAKTKEKTNEKEGAKKSADPSAEEVHATGDSQEARTGRVWVLTFQGGRNDVTASGVKQLREEITAVVSAADPLQDEVVLKLDSPGGTVTGYGLAGAQLMRLKEAGLRLTVAIDQVAASGGYLMACTADHIVCSPFAVIGSIGVVQELPVVFERLEREGIKFETTTAGKYKRTLTPFKQPTDEDRQKNKEDLMDVLKVFKDFVHTSRPSVDIENVATGETWLGPLAKERGLVDGLMTSDSLLLGFVKDGRQVLEVGLAQRASNPLLQAVASISSALAGGGSGAGASAAAAAASSLTGGATEWARQTPGLTPPMARAQPGPMARYDSAWDAML